MTNDKSVTLREVFSRSEWRVLPVFLAVSFVVNLLSNCYSPIFKLVSCLDAACFYMEGKAWAHGLVPYVDFIDVKGPLLFWIHRVGYTLAPQSTTGIFLIHVVATAVTLIAGYMTARLFISSCCRAAVAALLSLPFLFIPSLYICGGQAEELMLPFLAWLVYFLCRFECSPFGRKPAMVAMLGLCLGIGGCATFLIKYNASPVFAVAAALVSLQMMVHGAWREWLRCLLPSITTGFLIVAAPFALYMAATGSLDDFFNVYFLLNFKTYFSGGSGFVGSNVLNGIVYFSDNILRGIHGTWVLVSCLFFFLPPFAAGERICRIPESSIVLCLSALSAYVCCSSGFGHYMLFCTPLCLIPCIWLVQRLDVRLSPWLVVAVACWAGYVTVRCNARWESEARMRVTQKLSKAEKEVDDYVNSVPGAKILYLGCLDYGFGVAGGALPAAPEWFTLNGSGPAYRQRQLAAIRAGKPDFVVCVDYCPYLKPAERTPDYTLFKSRYSETLQKCGYSHLASFNEGRQRNGLSFVSLYCRSGLVERHDAERAD